MRAARSAIVGVLVLAGDTGLDDDSGDFSQVPGILLSALVVAIGYFVLSAVRRGPVATAGTVAAALGVPAFMFFVTFDENGFPPYNTEAILIVSTAVWLGTYLIGPGKGRPFFLGSGLIALWFTVLELTENVFESPFDPFGASFFGTDGSESFEATGDLIDPTTGEIIDTGGDSHRTGGFEEVGYDPPDPATIGMLSLGARRRVPARRAAARPRRAPRRRHAVLVRGHPCLAVGVIGLAPDLEAAGTGLLLVGIGLALAYNGATVWRRATSWIGGAAMAARARPLPRRHGRRQRHHRRDALHRRRHRDGVRRPPDRVGHQRTRRARRHRRRARRAPSRPPGPGRRTGGPAPRHPSADPDAPWKPPIPPAAPAPPGDGRRRHHRPPA